MKATAALALLLFRHWARAALPNRLRRDKGRRASAGIFRFAYLALMSAWGGSVGHLVSGLDSPEQRLRGAAWIIVGLLGLAVIWSSLTRGPTLRGEVSPLEASFLDTLPLREGSRLAVGLLERLFLHSVSVAALAGVAPSGRAIVIALAISTAGVLTGEASMRVARVLFPAMAIARARTYLLVIGQVAFLMCVVQAPYLARARRIGPLVAGWPSFTARALVTGEGLAVVLVACGLAVVLALGAVLIAERIGYDKVDLVPADRLTRAKADVLVVDRIDDVLRRREPGGRWGPVVMTIYTGIIALSVVVFAWSARRAAAEQAPEMVRGACGLAAFGSFVVVTARASRMATRDVAARALLAPLPLEPRALLAGKVARLRRDAVMVVVPLLALLATPWPFAFRIEVAWRTFALLLAAALSAKAAASIAFLTVGAGSKKGPGGSFVVESILVLAPLAGVATAQYAWAVVVPLAALALVSREASRSALKCVRWIDDADDFERETPIWRALLVLGAFQSTQVLTSRLLAQSVIDPATQLAIAYAVSSVVLVLLTTHARREAPPMRLLASPAWLAAGVGMGLASGGLALGYLRLLPSAPPAFGSHVAIAIIAVGFAPIAEEIFFRGWLLPCIEDEVPRRRWLAPLLSAFAFAAVHPPLSFVPVFVLGVAASLLFARTRALGPGICAHATHNAVALLAAVYAT